MGAQCSKREGPEEWVLPLKLGRQPVLSLAVKKKSIHQSIRFFGKQTTQTLVTRVMSVAGRN